MNSDTPEIRRVVIEVSEPWELARQSDEPPLVADIAQIRPGDPSSRPPFLLLELSTPIEREGTTYPRLVAQLADDRALRVLGDGNIVEAQLYGIPPDREIPDPLDATWWRGGLGMLGSLRRA